MVARLSFSSASTLVSIEEFFELNADGDDFVINGQKVFTSLASDADYIWLATRTDQDAPKHAGLTMFVVDMKTPGIKAEPMDLLSSHDICTTFFDDVRVPKTALVGELNKGWDCCSSSLVNAAFMK